MTSWARLLGSSRYQDLPNKGNNITYHDDCFIRVYSSLLIYISYFVATRIMVAF